jgi:hypothetical protein
MGRKTYWNAIHLISLAFESGVNRHSMSMSQPKVFFEPSYYLACFYPWLKQAPLFGKNFELVWRLASFCLDVVYVGLK